MSGRRAKRLRKLARAFLSYEAKVMDAPRMAIALNYRVDGGRRDGRRKALKLARAIARLRARVRQPGSFDSEGFPHFRFDFAG